MNFRFGVVTIVVLGLLYQSCFAQNISDGDLVAMRVLRDTWGVQSNWVTAADPCTWSGVNCTLTLPQRVTRLELASRLISGTIPTIIGWLNQLNILHLGANNLTGTIPTQIGNLTSLTFLQLSMNRLSGPIPTQIGLMTALGQIYIHSTGFLNGPLPTEIALLTLLRDLVLYGNLLNGTIPTQIGRYRFASLIQLHVNRLTGPLPTELGMLSTLRMFYAYSNSISGPLPTEIGTMTSLNVFSCFTNGFTGTIPTEIGMMTALNEFTVHGNTLNGSIPSEIARATALNHFRVNNNRLRGTLPTQMGLIRNLQTVTLGSNGLTGPLPTTFGQLSNLRILNLQNNGLSGPIPAQLVQCSSLQELILNNNSFTGILPAQLQTLVNLTQCNVDRNPLTTCSGVTKCLCLLPPTPFPTPPPMPTAPTPINTDVSTTTESTDGGSAVTSGNDSSIGLIAGAGGGGAALCLLIVLIVVIVIVRRRRNNTTKRGASTNANASIDLTLSSEAQKTQYDNLPRESSSNAFNQMSTTNQQYQYLGSVTAGQASTTQQARQPQQSQQSQYFSIPLMFNNVPSVDTTDESQASAYAEFALLSKSILSTSALDGVVDIVDLQIQSKLGEGNFGAVYLAMYKQKTPVAVKMIKTDGLESENAARLVAEFKSEASLLSKIPPHTNVLRFVGLCNEPLLLVTEFVDGGSLKSYMTSPSSAMSIGDGVRMMLEVARGVNHLHTNSIVHRDLATRNVLLRAVSVNNGRSEYECVIGDMGMARLHNAQDQYARTRTVTLPLKWSAPETLRERKFSTKSDMWSFGCLCIEILTRTPDPLPDMQPVDAAMAIVGQQLRPEPPSLCPPQLLSSLQSCFEWEPQNRPSAQKLIDVLQSIR